jgi:hypothetical protein
MQDRSVISKNMPAAPLVTSAPRTAAARWRARPVSLLFRIDPAIRKAVGKRKYKETIAAFEEHYLEVDARTDREKGIMAFHRMFLITGLALFKSLRGEFSSRDDAIDAIHTILWNGPMSRMVRIVAFFIGRSRDPFHSYLKVLGPNNEWFFPCPPWEKVSVEIQDGIGWHQKKCPYVDFFGREGVRDLARAYGDMDIRIAALLPDHVELKRDHAMCRGDGHCDFLYYRK